MKVNKFVPKGVKNSYEQKLMRQSGVIAAKALKRSLESIKVGVTELEVDKEVEKEIYKNGGDISYKTVQGYQYATCITVNEEVVHGIPADRKFEGGDLVSVDLAVMYKGWHTDCAWSILVEEKGEIDSDREEKIRFLQVGEQALRDGIDQATEGNRVGDISAAIQKRVEEAGYSVVRSLVGHGVGKSLHEDPEIPGFGIKGKGHLLKSGMTLAIEVIYTKGDHEVVLGQDGWTFSSADGSWGGLFEMTVIVGKEGAEVLTDWKNA
ncbi:type I methionyl aminopeptidase [Candidatus Daviesbacteria bacterium]|nr:type I methionyl aminopeptidase [Candidatus Daviesbacteria bacterium]